MLVADLLYLLLLANFVIVNFISDYTDNSQSINTLRFCTSFDLILIAIIPNKILIKRPASSWQGFCCCFSELNNGFSQIVRKLFCFKLC